MQSSCAWRRRPLSTCSGASTCPTRMPASAWAASAWRVTPTPSRSANSLVVRRRELCLLSWPVGNLMSSSWTSQPITWT
uniref:Alternative protein ABCF1 n=1 Tax=Homo sapiens TaxID=9606 RepID=L0R6B8_HUMAN|nr:alternative protein ABCF1 [Homo sapiens]